MLVLPPALIAHTGREVGVVRNSLWTLHVNVPADWWKNYYYNYNHAKVYVQVDRVDGCHTLCSSRVMNIFSEWKFQKMHEIVWHHFQKTTHHLVCSTSTTNPPPTHNSITKATCYVCTYTSTSPPPLFYSHSLPVSVRWTAPFSLSSSCQPMTSMPWATPGRRLKKWLGAPVVTVRVRGRAAAVCDRGQPAMARRVDSCTS